jgi:hypothetical protein
LIRSRGLLEGPRTKCRGELVPAILLGIPGIDHDVIFTLCIYERDRATRALKSGSFQAGVEDEELLAAARAAAKRPPRPSSPANAAIGAGRSLAPKPLAIEARKIQ